MLTCVEQIHGHQLGEQTAKWMHPFLEKAQCSVEWKEKIGCAGHWLLLLVKAFGGMSYCLCCWSLVERATAFVCWHLKQSVVQNLASMCEGNPDL